VGDCLELVDFLGPGGHIVRRYPAVPVDSLYLIEVEKTGVGLLVDPADPAHVKNLPKVIIIYYTIKIKEIQEYFPQDWASLAKR
jgi:hypothetical protein